jgi:hypothetical protein
MNQINDLNIKSILMILLITLLVSPLYAEESDLEGEKITPLLIPTDLSIPSNTTDTTNGGFSFAPTDTESGFHYKKPTHNCRLSSGACRTSATGTLALATTVTTCAGFSVSDYLPAAWALNILSLLIESQKIFYPQGLERHPPLLIDDAPNSHNCQIFRNVLGAFCRLGLAFFITQYYFGIEIAPISQNDLSSLLFVLAGLAFIVDMSDEAIYWCNR